MRVAFFGTPKEAVAFLDACCETCQVACVVTSPDRPRGRGRRLKPCPVKEAAASRGLAVLQPLTCKDPEFIAHLRAFNPDTLVVVAYGQILPPELLDVAAVALNVHFSLLPQLRGAAPVERALEWGLTTTAVTVQVLSPRLDAGPVVCQRIVPIHRRDDAPSLRDRLVAVGVECLREVLRRLHDTGRLSAAEQLSELATYAGKIDRHEAAADFSAPASELVRKVKALADARGVYCFLDAKRLKLWKAASIWRVEPGGSPGTVEAATEAGPLVACGGHGVVVTEAQLEGKKRMSGPELLRGRVLEVGQRLTACPPGSGQAPGG